MYKKAKIEEHLGENLCRLPVRSIINTANQIVNKAPDNRLRYHETLNTIHMAYIWLMIVGLICSYSLKYPDAKLLSSGTDLSPKG